MKQKRFAWIQPNSRTSSTLTHLPVRLPLNAASLGNSSSGSFMPSKRALPGLGESTRNSPDFLREGILATYSPTDATPHQFKRNLSDQEWLAFLELAHTNRKAGYEKYRAFYLSTDGQIYDSDLHAFGVYLSDYSRHLASRLPTSRLSTLMITELFVQLQHSPNSWRQRLDSCKNRAPR